jgi:pimeloyl-ACP methyl ester carboxylesterase
MGRRGTYEAFEPGTLGTWDVSPHVAQITCPTLLLSGEDDQCQAFAMQPFFDKMPNVVNWHHFRGSHLAWFEQAEEYSEVVRRFLNV